ncbi:preprotein translocase subunit SecG [Maritimibacter sp. DP07]|uniref:Protein-export membrane protein SecG n=1 Tax=Maritimibacter harenae TaxID=2606218 RepID=A0A845M1A8_9RHOB|nr:preprotein translocase subunit SecG [Maritimibacter harenae]MZR14130.1 preprotein translocase subunit SecG [Maritimibacter harenae]
MENVLLVVLLLLALSLIGVVLLQRSEGGGLGMGGGGGGGAMSARGAATALSKLTWILGIAFLACSLALTIISARSTADSSVTDLISTPANEPADETAPAAPALPDVTDMMPSQSGDQPTDAPAAPPRAD